MEKASMQRELGQVAVLLMPEGQSEASSVSLPLQLTRPC